MPKSTHHYPVECLRLKIITDSKYVYSVYCINYKLL